MKGLYVIFNSRDACGAVIFFPNATYNKEKVCDSFNYMMHLTFLYAIASVKPTEIIRQRVESFLCLCYLCTSEYFFIGNIWIYSKNKTTRIWAGSSPLLRPSSE